MKNKEILLHTDDALRAVPSARKQGLRYALLVAGISLVTQLVALVVNHMMGSTGGLAGIGARSVLASVQTVVTFAAMLILPFLEWGHCAVALRTAQKQRSDNSILFHGLQRFAPLLRLSILRVLLGLMLMIAASNAAAVVYTFLPGSVQTMQSMEHLLTDPNAIMDPTVSMTIMQQLWPMYLISGMLFVALIIPIFYRLRLADWAILEGENRVLQTMLASFRTMRGHCLQLAGLDLWQWEYYLLMGIAAVVAYGDKLLGITEPWGYWVFYLASLLLQTAVTALLLPRVHTSYAAFYLDKTQPQEDI